MHPSSLPHSISHSIESCNTLYLQTLSIDENIIIVTIMAQFYSSILHSPFLPFFLPPQITQKYVPFSSKMSHFTHAQHQQLKNRKSYPPKMVHIPHFTPVQVQKLMNRSNLHPKYGIRSNFQYVQTQKPKNCSTFHSQYDAHMFNIARCRSL